MRGGRLLPLALLTALSCGTEAEPPAGADTGVAAADETGLVPLEPGRLFRRMSLDLRGTLPTLAELERLEQSPEDLEAMRDALLEDPRLEDRLVSLFGERWHTRVDVFDIEYYDYHLDPLEEHAFERAVGEEPLRLMARVAVEDRPWYEVVTADHTVANEVLGELWPLDYPAGETGWLEVPYTDGRPAVGVLATNGLWWRYTTDTSNMNRRRASAIANLLLCVDFLARPVSFSAETSQVDDIEEAVRTDPYCLACHSSLDPIAANLFGFWWLSQYNVFEETVYHPERELLAEEVLGTGPAWFGEPMAGLSELGVQIANDPRFYQCTAESTAATLWRREARTEDFDTVVALQERFVAEDLRYKALLAAVTDTAEYRAGGLSEAAAGTPAEEAVTRRMLSTDQLASAVEELTGFTWDHQGFRQLHNDELGYRVLAGGVDGTNVYRLQDDPGLTWALVTRRFAQAAADHAVQRELVLGGEPRRLFGAVTLDTLPGEAAFEAELAALHLRTTGQPAEADWLEEITALWEAAEAQDGPAAAWTAVVTALLRDPDFLSY